MTDFLDVIPTRTFGDGRLCENGDGCVLSPPTVLSRFNPSRTCYCCQARAQRGLVAVPGREPSTAEVMSERSAVQVAA